MTRENILLVEDDQRLSAALAKVLTRHGYTVAQAMRRQDAVVCAHQAHPAAVLLDIVLPDGTGWQFLEEFRRQPENRLVPVIIMSSCVVSRGQARLWGVSTSLVKPFHIGSLLQALETALGVEAPSRGGKEVQS